jgi:hypothetical protein
MSEELPVAQISVSARSIDLHRLPGSANATLRAKLGDGVQYLYTEHDMNVLRVRAFAFEAAAGHVGSLVDELDEMVGWAYSQLHRQNYANQEDALMLDSMKLRLLMREP